MDLSARRFIPCFAPRSHFPWMCFARTFDSTHHPPRDRSILRLTPSSSQHYSSSRRERLASRSKQNWETRCNLQLGYHSHGASSLMLSSSTDPQLARQSQVRQLQPRCAFSQLRHDRRSDGRLPTRRSPRSRRSSNSSSSHARPFRKCCTWFSVPITSHRILTRHHRDSSSSLTTLRLPKLVSYRFRCETSSCRNRRFSGLILVDCTRRGEFSGRLWSGRRSMVRSSRIVR